MTNQNIDTPQQGESKLKPRANVAPEKKRKEVGSNSPTEPVNPSEHSPESPNELYEEQLPPEHELT